MSFLGEQISDKVKNYVPGMVKRHPNLAVAAGAVAVGLLAWRYRKEIVGAVNTAWTTAKEMAEEHGVADELRKMGNAVVNQFFQRSDVQSEAPASAAEAAAPSPEPTPAAAVRPTVVPIPRPAGATA